MADEITSTLADLSDIDRELVIGQMGTILEAATFGRLEFNNDVDMVSIDPDMWELRFRAAGKEYRLYIAEPHTHPVHLVALKFHHKITDGSDQDIHDAQDAEIAVAALRFKSGSTSNWGSNT